jgi:Uma2 family endonuclease
MVTTIQRKTIADLLAMPDDGRHYELIHGEIIVAAAPGEPHMEAGHVLFFLLTPLDRVHHLGKLYSAPYDIHLPTGDLVEPDLFFLSKDRWSLRRGSHIEGAPDLIMEITSPSTRTRDRVTKRAIYEASGVREYWIIDLQTRTIEALTLRNGRYEPISHDGSIVRSLLFPILEVDAKALFESLSSWPQDQALRPRPLGTVESAPSTPA